MTRKYNFILAELLYNSDDKDYLDAFVQELVNRRVDLEVIYLSHQSLHMSQNAEINKLLKRALIVRQNKLTQIKKYEFEKAANFRNEEKEIMELFEKYGYSLYYFKGIFVLYNVSISKHDNKITLMVYTESKSCINLIKKIKRKIALN